VASQQKANAPHKRSVQSFAGEMMLCITPLAASCSHLQLGKLVALQQKANAPH
jgi:hypothetical protein